MNAKARNRLLWVGLPLVALLAGCGNYRITFEAADVINAWGEDITREDLDRMIQDYYRLRGWDEEGIPASYKR